MDTIIGVTPGPFKVPRLDAYSLPTSIGRSTLSSSSRGTLYTVKIPAIMAAWSPPVVSASLGIAILLHLEDG